MSNPILVSTSRGAFDEYLHRGAAAIVHASGDIVEAWGDIDAVILPRSSVKMVQALALVESGAADRARLSSAHLALACSSHEGAPVHVDLAGGWLGSLGLDASALQCGPQRTRDTALRKADPAARRIFNGCSGKHAGFLAYGADLGVDPAEYLSPTGAVQSAVAERLADLTGAAPPLPHAIDGCSAPNFAAPLVGIARAMAAYAGPEGLGGVRGRAMGRLADAMRAHPLLISGEGRACKALSEASGNRATVKLGADLIYTGIFPEKQLGFCIKMDTGDTQAVEVACAALLVRIGAVASDDPAIRAFTEMPVCDLNGNVVGQRRATLDHEQDGR